MEKLTFKEFCVRYCDGLYDPHIPEDAQCAGYKTLRRMVGDGICPASMDEMRRWETYPTTQELCSTPDIRYLRFLHPILRPYIVKNWEKIKQLPID